MRWGIASRFTLFISLLVLIATSTVGFMVYRGAKQSLMHSSADRLAHTAEIIGVRFSASLEAIGKDVHFLAATPPVQGIVRARMTSGLDPETAIRDEEWGTQLAEVFKAFLESRPSYLQAAFIGAVNGGRELVRVEKRGSQVVFADIAALQRRNEETYYKESVALPPGSLYLSDIRLVRPGAGQPAIPVLYAAAPVYIPGGNAFGIIVISVDFRNVFDTMETLVDSTKAFYIASSRGTFLLHPDSTRTAGLRRSRDDLIQKEFPEVEALLSGGESEVRVLNARLEPATTGIAYFSRLPFDRGVRRQNLILGVTEPHETILSGVRRVRNQSALITLLFCLIGIGLTLSASGYLTHPLRQITRAVSRFGRDGAGVPLPVQRGDEIGLLARAFDAMARQIQDQIHELEDEERRHRTILETSAEGIIVTDAAGTIETFNEAAETILGYRAQEVIGRKASLLIQPGPNGQAPHGQRAAEGWMSLGQGDEAVGHRKDGRTVPLSITWSSFLLSREKRYTLFFQDITERKAAEAAQAQLLEALEAERASLQQLSETLEERVKERTADLMRINKALEYRNRELQDFAYVASHDLQEPLRKLRAFGGLLQSDYSEQLDEKGRFYIQRMCDSAERMSQLIADLLSFSRIRTKGKPFEKVDLSQIVGDVLADLEICIAESGARVEVGPLPVIEADPTQMRQLLQNLIANAVKFRSPETAPIVEVRATVEPSTEPAEPDEEVCRIEIRDNGIGFEEKYLDRIFSPFQRLHNRDAYEGTGMGLTICRRIAERHGGTITARSIPGDGSTFIVLLPVHQRQSGSAEELETVDTDGSADAWAR